MTKILERDAAITGVGMSAIGRNVNQPAIELALDSITAAVKHAGLEMDDIDGLCTNPGVSETPGMAPVPLRDIKNGLGLKLNWFSSIQEGPSTMSSIMTAAMAVATGQARHVVCHRTAIQYSMIKKLKQFPLADGAAARRWNNWQGWAYPFNALSPIHSHAMITKVRMERHGLTREQLGAWVLNCRRNAQLNPTAMYRDPLTMDDYLSTRIISDPLCMFDCDAPIDGSVSFIVSSLDAARDMKNPPLRIEAMSGAMYGKDSWDQFEDITSMPALDAGAHLWDRTDLKPSDIDVANLYDGFSIQPIIWAEALGFCEPGEGGEFVSQPGQISLEGNCPMNTGGGQLSGGRLHGFGLLRESCLQLWGDGGDRQVQGNPELALTSVGGGALAGCLILSRQ
jgi:acetyl-CoA acetyltransferase